MKKFISLILVLLLLISSVAGCTKDPGTTVDSTTESTTPGIPDSTEIPIIQDGKPVISVVRADSSDEFEQKAMTTIANEIKQLCGTAPTIKADFSKDGSYDSSSYEILIGFTGYSESQEALKTLKYGEYSIHIKGNKIVILTHITSDLTYVVSKFVSFMKSNISADKSSLVFTADSVISGVTNDKVSALPTFNKAKPAAFDLTDRSAYQFMYTKITESEYNEYLEKVAASGYTEYQRRSANNNQFATYKNDTHAVTAYYIPNGKTMRLIIEPVENLFIQGDNTYTKITEPKLMFMGSSFTQDGKIINGNMSFVIQLSDGRYIVVDGGCATPGYANKIYSTLVKYNVLDTIQIAAWVFTHTHGDHVGGFMKLTELHKNELHIENFIFNFCTYDTLKLIEDSASSYYLSAVAAMEKYPNAKISKCHTGQTFEIADAKFEFYYTPEDYILPTRKFEKGSITNNTSIIFSVDIGGQRIMFLGDSQVISNDLTAATFGSYLKSDIVQVAHHGGVGGTNSIYKAVDPAVALFTTDDSRVYHYMEVYPANNYLVTALNVKEWYNVHDRTYVFTLPYTPTGTGWVVDKNLG